MEKIPESTFKVIITGPECTGKSTLSRQLGEYFELPWLPEYARTYLNKIKRPYKDEDLIEIAKGQIQQEDKILEKNPPAIFLDTSLEVLKVWSEWKYESCDPFILNNFDTRVGDLYLLLSPDMAWESDPLRENPNDREIIFDIYKKELERLQKPFEIISGIGLVRTRRAIKTVNKYLSNTK